MNQFGKLWAAVAPLRFTLAALKCGEQSCHKGASHLHRVIDFFLDTIDSIKQTYRRLDQTFPSTFFPLLAIVIAIVMAVGAMAIIQELQEPKGRNRHIASTPVNPNWRPPTPTPDLILELVGQVDKAMTDYLDYLEEELHQEDCEQMEKDIGTIRRSGVSFAHFKHILSERVGVSDWNVVVTVTENVCGSSYGLRQGW